MSDLKRIQWRCRRGLQEMDIAFKKFLQSHYPELDARQQELFECLLDEADLDILNWIYERDPTPDPYQELIVMIRQSVGQNG